MVRPQQKEVIMRTATTPHPQRAPLPLTLSAALANYVRRIVRAWWRDYCDRQARKATLIILKSLDERTLRDIGITASEIESCVHNKLCDRRRRYDASWRC
jgi:uncharacterized protein YjiS (DUF1127 family)